MQRIFTVTYAAGEEGLRLPESLQAELQLADGAPAVARVSRGCLMVLPWLDTPGIRMKVVDLALELEAVQERMATLARSLPDVPADEDAVLPEAEILGTLECVLADDLGPAIRKLRQTAEMAEER